MSATALLVGSLVAHAAVVAAIAHQLVERRRRARAGIVRGRAVAATAEPIIEITLEQVEETGPRGWAVWRVENRTAHVRPFELLTADGLRLRIEPDRDALVVDGLELVKVSPRRRLMIGRVRHGDEIEVRGHVERTTEDAGAYRSAPSDGVVRRPARTRMLIARGSLAALEHRQARLQLRALVLLAALLIAQLILYRAAPLAGQDLVGLLGTASAGSLCFLFVYVVFYGRWWLEIHPWYERRRCTQPHSQKLDVARQGESGPGSAGPL